MPQFERRLYDPAEDAELDGGADEEEGSRLPLLIVIALVVLASFAGVVWLAYTQGVQRGREDAPRIIAAQQGNRLGSEPKYSDLKIYQRARPDRSARQAATLPQPKPVQTQTNKPPAAPLTKPASSIVPPPVPKPALKTAARPPAIAPSNARQQAANTAPTPTASAIDHPSPAAPPSASAPQAQQREATGAPHAIAPMATNKMPPAVKPAATSAPPGNPAAQQAMPAAANSVAPSPPNAAGFVLQIGSYTSEAEANASWQTYKAGHPSVADYAPDVQKADLGSRGTWYRLRVGPFASMQDAAAACAKLKAQGSACLPTKR